MKTNLIHTGDAFDVLPELPDESVHAVVTDPPYGLAFMGRDWDDFEPKEYQEWCEKWAREAKRILKPGGHLLAFSGNRTHHRLFTGVEDAGFEIRDTLTWHYGSGFPKASDISKTIDKREGVEPDRVKDTQESGMWRDDSDWNDCYNHEIYEEATTDAAKKWDGWKTGLKPATEFVVMARKPFDGATVDCVLEHGTGALNIDGCRVGTNGDETRTTIRGSEANQNSYAKSNSKIGDVVVTTASTEGRYPSNVIFDEIEAEALDQEVGECESGKLTAEMNNNADSKPFDTTHGEFERKGQKKDYEANTGGPSRYFYTSKASKAERTLDGKITNDHPTVKPQDLMEWAIRLVTRKGQIILDPFVGSGTTCMAAKAIGRDFVGIERQAKYADIARVRCGLTPTDPSVVRDDEQQSGLSDW